MEKKRSVGVTVFGRVFIIVSMLQLGCFIFFLGVTDDFFILSLIYAGLFSTIGIGLLKLKEWTRRLLVLCCLIATVISFSLAIVGVVYVGLGAALGITDFIKDHFIKFLLPAFPIGVVHLIVFYFFTRPKVREQFKQGEMIESASASLSRKKRSPGVTVFGWLYLFASAGSLVSILTMKSRLATHQATHFTLPSSYYYVVQSSKILEFIVFLIIGIGLLRLLKWARILTITILFVSFVYSIIVHFLYIRPYIIPYFVQTNRPIPIVYISMVIGFLWMIMLFYFFTRPKVKEQFK